MTLRPDQQQVYKGQYIRGLRAVPMPAAAANETQCNDSPLVSEQTAAPVVRNGGGYPTAATGWLHLAETGIYDHQAAPAAMPRR